MALPVQKAPTFKCELPVSGLQIKFRPFLVKEQNHLMITRESQDSKEIFDAIIELIKSVTNGEVDASKLPMADLEYLFLQTRARSVGETVNIPLICQANDECSAVHSEQVDLTKVNVNVSEMADNKIQISDNLIVEMIPPTARVIHAIEGRNETDMVMPLMRACLTRIYDKEEVYEMSDHRDAEIDEFVESLQVTQFEKISDYFGSLPSLSHEVKWTCPECGGDNYQVIKGLDSFF